MVRFHRVSKFYPPRIPALIDVSVEIQEGEFVFLTGPSGAGKTTLLRLLLGAELPTAGQLIVRGRNLGRTNRRTVAMLRREIGMVFQDSRLLPGLPVLANVAIGAEAIGVSARESRARAFSLLRDLGLKDLVNRSPSSLSGGEQQRVALARALVNRPRLFLADEPTGNLDGEASTRILERILRAHEEGATVVIATHDRHLIEAVDARIIALDSGRLARPDEEG